MLLVNGISPDHEFICTLVRQGQFVPSIICFLYERPLVWYDASAKTTTSKANTLVSFKLSNIHAFVPVWMAPMMLKNFRLIAAQSSPVSPLGQLDYREGWFAIVPKDFFPASA